MILLFLVGLAVGAAAPATETITVTAPRVAPQNTDIAARAYLRDVLPVPVFGQYARWADPICLSVSGLDDAIAARVVRRVTDVATEAAIRIAKPGCKTNLVMAFTEDAANTTRIITRKQPRQIARLSVTERQTLLNATLPVRWWHVFELRDRDGMLATPRGSAALMTVNTPSGGPLSEALSLGPDAVMTDNRSSSLISTNLAVWAKSGVVVIDVTLATGKSLDAVVDYAALAALAPMKLPPPAPGVPSILALFTSAEPATDNLSPWDRAWLAALYRIPMDRRGDRQRGDLTARLAAAMQK